MVNPVSYEAASAHYGWRDWLVQRVTAVVMLLYTLLIFAIVLWNGGLDYALWKSLFANHAFKLATFLCVIALAWHAWVGVRNIAMDYVKPTGWRLALQTAVICLLVGYVGWTIEVLWGAAL